MKLLIVDGHAYAYRAFHAIRELRSPTGQPCGIEKPGAQGESNSSIPQGQPTNAIYGFIKMLAKMRARLAPTHLIVVWDGGLCAERMTALPEYKAHRPEMPADLGPQIDEIVRYLEAANITSFCRDGVEADDYIACLARQAVKAEMEVVIASSDKDFMQLVTDEAGSVEASKRSSVAADHASTLQRFDASTAGRVGLLNPNDKTETVWTAAQVRAKAGVEPGQIVDWLSLIGDSVDNIPGVPGVGPKTAADLIKQFGSVAALYGRLPEVKSERLRAALTAAAAAVRRNQDLVRLREDLPCEFLPEEMADQPGDAERMSPLFRQWGFRSLLAELESGKVSGARGQVSSERGSNLSPDLPHLALSQEQQAVLL